MSCPRKNQEVEINYTIKNSKGAVLDSTVGAAPFRYLLGSNKIIPEIEEQILGMKKGEKESFEISKETAEKIFNLILQDIEDITDTLTIEIELVDFYDKIKSIYELTVEEKFDRAKEEKEKFAANYKGGKYEAGVDNLKESLNYINKIPEKDLSPEIKSFKLSLQLNFLNVYNKLKQYQNTIKLGKELADANPKAAKLFYHLANAYAQLDEFEEAEKNYKILEALMGENKGDQGLVAVKKLIEERRIKKENDSKKKMKAFLNKGLFERK